MNDSWILGRYQLIRKLAAGGMAELFLAKAIGAKGFEKTMVIKRIHGHLMDSEPDAVLRFFEEAQLVARLTHPNIVQIFDYGEVNGQPFIAMEYVDGTDLNAMAEKADISDVLCARIVSLVCEALHYAHSFRDPKSGRALEIVHRDISPDNILLSRSGVVKLTDFGIARIAGQVHRTKAGAITGKLSYMAPELLRGLESDRRTDIYSLGAVLYKLMCGRMPFNAKGEAGIIHAIVKEPAVPITQRRAEVPPALERVLERALAKDRDARYQSVREMQVDIEDYILSTSDPVSPAQIANLFLPGVEKTKASVTLPVTVALASAPVALTLEDDILSDDVETRADLASFPPPLTLEDDIFSDEVKTRADFPSAPVPLPPEQDPLSDEVKTGADLASAPAPLPPEQDPLPEEVKTGADLASAPASLPPEQDPLSDEVKTRADHASAPVPFTVENDRATAPYKLSSLWADMAGGLGTNRSSY